MSLFSDDEDFDICGISQDDTRFSSNPNSPFCPKVGLCGHSFCGKSLTAWFQARKKGEYHKKETALPCPYHCSETVKLKGKQTISQEITAFRPNKLVSKSADDT